MTLHLYIARRFVWTFFSVFAIFFIFMSLLDLVEQLRRFDQMAFGEVLKLTLLNMPKSLYQIMPLVVILSSIALFLSLARSSELVVIRAAGRSGTTAILAPAAAGLLIGAMAVAVFNPIVAGTSKQYSQLRELYRNGGTSTLSIGSEGLWLRQGDETGQTVIRAARANPEATELYNVSFFHYAPGGGPVQRIEADRATLSDGAWVLHTAKVWPLAAGVNSESSAVDYKEYSVSSTLTQESIRDRFGTPSAVSIWQLPAYINDLEVAGFSARRYFVWMQMELAKPFFFAAMILVGAAFTMRHSRLGKTGVSVLSAVLLGFGLYYIRNFAQILGENGQVDAILAAWAPPVASILLAMGLILHREEG